MIKNGVFPEKHGSLDEVKPFQRKNATNEPQHAGVFDVKNKLKKLHSINKTRTSKVGAISKAQKANVSKICPGRIYEKLRKQFRDTQRVPLILDKTPKLLIPRLRTKKHFFFVRKMSHSAEKSKAGPFRFIKIHSVANYQKIRRGAFDTFKAFRKKVAQCLKKSTCGLFSLVQFCR